MAENSITILGDFREIQGLKDQYIQDINEYAQRIAEALRENIQVRLVNANAFASRALFHNISTDVFFTPATDIFFEVGSTLPYAKTLEEGLKPGTEVPIASILRWMSYKDIEGGIEVATKIARKLEDEGYEGRHIFRDAVDEFGPKLDRIAEEVFFKD